MINIDTLHSKEFLWLSNKLKDKALYIYCFAVISFLALVIRIYFFDYESGDFYWYLNPWYNTMKSGGLEALGEQVGDYNMLYQFLIALMTFIPIKPLLAFKLTSIIFDYLLAFSMVKLIELIIVEIEHIELYKIFVFIMTLFSPLIMLNSAMWAQCDVMYVFFVVQSLVYLLDNSKSNHYSFAFIMLGVAFAFKLQTIFIIPLYLYYWFRERKFNLFQFILIPITMLITTIPNVFYGRNPLDVFTNYIDQTNTYTDISKNYPSFWTIFLEVGIEKYENPIKYIGTISAVLILGIIMLYWMYKKIKFTPNNIMHMAFVFSYTCVLFLPRMHERYGFMYEVLALLLYVINQRTRQPMLLLFFVNLIAYWRFLMSFNYNLQMASVVNFVIWLIYLYISTITMLENSKIELEGD